MPSLQNEYSDLLRLTKAHLMSLLPPTMAEELHHPQPTATVAAHVTVAPVPRRETKPTPDGHDTKQFPATRPSEPNCHEDDRGSFSDIRGLYAKIEHTTAHRNDIPRDAVASMPDVLIVTVNETSAETTFLHSVAKAIRERLCSAEVISAALIEQKWSWNIVLSGGKAKMIIMNDNSVKKLKTLAKQIHSSAGMPFVGNVRLLPLQKVSLYIDDKERKTTLWRTICQELKKK